MSKHIEGDCRSVWIRSGEDGKTIGIKARLGDEWIWLEVGGTLRDQLKKLPTDRASIGVIVKTEKDPVTSQGCEVTMSADERYAVVWIGYGKTHVSPHRLATVLPRGWEIPFSWNIRVALEPGI